MEKPSFYKIMTEDYTQKLQIPHSFLKHFKGVLPRECILRSHIGKSWIVRLEEVDKCIFFSDSWGNFVQDHSLEWGDFIMFTYEGSFEFHVNVFEKSGCEMDYVVASENRTRKIYENVSKDSNVQGDECAESNLNGKSLVQIEMVDDFSHEFLNIVPASKKEQILTPSLVSCKQRNGNPTNEAASSKFNLNSKTLVNQEMEDLLPLEILDVVPEPHKQERVISQSLGSSKQRIKNPTNEAASSCKAQKRDNSTAHRDKQPKVEVLQKEKAHSSRNLSFSVKLRPSYVTPRAYMYVPREFSRSYFTQVDDEVVLLVSGGKVSKRWVVNYISSSSIFSGGWRTFVRENHLKVDDVCSFEPVPGMVNTLNVVIHRKS
ncbi:B3 domain-containing transcription factor VRN1-like isoform X2 [Tripterygium wilfordii]|uniref:B3 domain-containing transcription factor VRN1-like isoform X2 n=1 Tax=Tripterygium wilfordii TaxID=458696 RepID=UPI0018F837DE|nr:B3 domain-containing transcription factor VRN1-like isoform X2 [Tripterygium wilfordii]